MKAIEFLKQNRVYEDETIYNSVGEIVGTVSQLMEEYAALCQPLVVGRSEQLSDFEQWAKLNAKNMHDIDYWIAEYRYQKSLNCA